MPPSYLVAVGHEAPAAAGNLTGLVVLASIAGSLAYGLLERQLADTRVILLAAALLAAGGWEALPTMIITFTASFTVLALAARPAAKAAP